MSTERRRILVVDDSEDIREMLQFVLETAGYSVRLAADGCEGLDAVRELRPDLIITDIAMPVMDGFQFLVQLRSDFRPPLPPVIVSSGFDVTAERAMALGALRFVAKPVESAVLLRTVEQVLSGQPTEAAELDRERSIVESARARAAAAAARLCAALAAQAPAFDDSVPVIAEWVSRYFGVAPAGIALVEDDGIRLAGVSRDSFIPARTKLSSKLLFETGVLAAGSSFLATENTQLLRGAYGEAHGLQFLVAVPLLFEDVPIGALGLFDRAPHPFTAEDLLILEGVGRNFSHALRPASPLVGNLGLVPSPLFDLMLASELALLHRERGALELLVVEMDGGAIDSRQALEILHRGSPRLALCRREVGTIALFKRDLNATSARDVITSSLSLLQASGAVRAAGWVSIVDSGLAPVPCEIALRLVDVALDHSRSTGGRRIERTLIVTEPTHEAASAIGVP
ncbi:MAG: integral rane sensor hybrid histidine kinase [bacterium]|nr:integral rane sensor hybrid histidine kinase [bacterium]